MHLRLREVADSSASPAAGGGIKPWRRQKKRQGQTLEVHAAILQHNVKLAQHVHMLIT